FPLILPAWTMPYEVFFYLAFTLAILIGGRLFTGLALIWSVAIVVANVMEIPVLGIWASFLLKPFHLQLLAGVGTSVLVRKFLPLKWGLPLLVAGLLMLVAGLTMHAQVEAWLPLYKRCWWALVFCVLIAGTAAYEMGRKHPVPVPRWMKALGRGSYSIYLVHSPVLVVLLAVIAPRGWLHGPAANLLLLLLAAIAIAAGLLCYHFLEIPLNRRFKTPLPKPNPPLADRSSPGSRLP
ncbi:MAG TPA: hypothetical protein VD994_03305, partial [Prosthecobacter sp.]|nr:hypothetical protein [Prosthecobacter sp.]